MMTLKNLKDSFSLDLRSLSYFRITLGLCIIYDLLTRMTVLKEFYTDDGVWPRSLFVSEMSHAWSFSFHLFSGEYFPTLLLFLFHLFLAVMFVVGKKTRLITFLLWLMTVSLHDRNWLVLTGADDITRSMLFICIFLPLSRVNSLDSKQNLDGRGFNFLSPWSLMFVAQICIIYLFTYFMKDSPAWHEEATAVSSALGLKTFTTGMGNWLSNSPFLSKVLTKSVINMEILAPLFVLFSFLMAKRHWMLRLSACLLGFLLHLGLATFMTLGVFPFVCLSLWIALLPSEAINYIDARLQIDKKIALILSPLKSILPPFSTKPAFSFPKQLTNSLKIASACFCVYMLASVLYWNLRKIEKLDVPTVTALKKPAQWFHWYQNWGMFSPYPKSHNEWLIVEPKYEEKADNLIEDPFNHLLGFEKEDLNFENYRKLTKTNSLMKKYVSNVSSEKEYLESFGKFICRETNRNRSKGRRLDSFKVYKKRKKVSTFTGQFEDYPTKKRKIWQHWCIKMPSRSTASSKKAKKAATP